MHRQEGGCQLCKALLKWHACMRAQIHYLERPCSDYVRAAVQTAADIHREDMPGDILIFLTGVLAASGNAVAFFL